MIAGLVGLTLVGASLYSIFVNIDPKHRDLLALCFRLGFYGIVALMFFKRAQGHKMGALQWGCVAMLCLWWSWESKTAAGVTVNACLAILTLVGAFVEMRVEASRSG